MTSVLEENSIVLKASLASSSLVWFKIQEEQTSEKIALIEHVITYSNILLSYQLACTKCKENLLL